MKHAKELSKVISQQTVPAYIRSLLQRHPPRLIFHPRVGWVRFGNFRRLQPISRVFGFDRGLCIDRYYIEHFLSKCALDVQGHILEVGDDLYTRRFGEHRIMKSDVLHAVEGNSVATLVADLANADHIPSKTFDCIICTQTLQVIYDVRSAIKTLHRILKPAGILLATVPGISQISRYDMDRWGDYWRFTDLSVRRLFDDIFGKDSATIEAHGNVLAACAFLHGLAARELKKEELEYHDPDYQVLITVRAVKPSKNI
jgi:hypothetical protein